MADGPIVAEVWRGSFLESVHHGHAVICDSRGDVVAAWGDPAAVVLPRSSYKMLQALPLVESGAAARFGLGAEQLALACSSHQGAPVHTGHVIDWLTVIERAESDLACGPETPRDPDDQRAMFKQGELPGRCHNNCSGKHTGFLTLERHIGGGPGYVDPDHPVQHAARAAIEEMCGEQSPGFGVDGCSAPNFGVSLRGLASAMARMAAPGGLGAARGAAALALTAAMKAHPELVAGEGRACTGLMNAMAGPGVVKTGAEGVFVAILPERGLGVAVKASDGAKRAAETMITALLVRLRMLEADHPEALRRMRPVLRNWDGLEVGHIAPAESIWAGGAIL